MSEETGRPIKDISCLRYFSRRINDRKDVMALWITSGILLFADMILSIWIIFKVPYTKIDWDAYMSQVDGFVSGERDYSKLAGDTGPLVYPAGFLYAFSLLKYITRGEVLLAQWCFGVLYLLNQALVFLVYIKAQVVPPWALALLCMSKRLHSIFVLRLFNDCFTMAFLYASVVLFQKRSWNWGLILFSVALSIKMNVLLFLPPLLVLLAESLAVPRAIRVLGVAVLVQVAIGLPFLLTFPLEYLKGAFNFGRVFIHFWSVNFKFIPDTVFVSKPFALSLLGAHLSLLILFAQFQWCRHDGGLLSLLCSHIPYLNASKKANQIKWLTPQHIAVVLFHGNFIGIVFARSLHYQFYSWYYHSIPALLWVCQFPVPVKLVLWLLIEGCWNVYPSTAASSLLLLACHLTILVGLFVSRLAYPYESVTAGKKER